MADIRSTLISSSDQLDNIDLASGPRDFTITGATLNEGAEQPLSIRLAEYDRPWKPGKTVRRVLDGIWGYETDDWTGRRVRLFRDESVSFGRQKTGGTRISHASHIDKPITLTLPISKGKFGEFTVKPLTESAAPTPTAAPTGPTAEQIAESFDAEALKRAWDTASPEIQALIVKRVAELDEAAS
jgi:hypothetical protein